MYIIEIDDMVNIKRINQFKDEVSNALRREKNIVLDFSKSKRLDLAVIQVIISLIKTAKLQNTSVKVKAANEVIKKQLRLCGVIR